MHGTSCLKRTSDRINMDLHEERSRFGSLGSTSLRNLSSSSSAFFSANQSPFFSPRSPTCQVTTRSNIPFSNTKTGVDFPSSISRIPDSECLSNIRFPSSEVSSIPVASTSSDSQKFKHVSSSTGISNNTLSYYGIGYGNDYFRHKEKPKKLGRSSHGTSYPLASTSLSSIKLRCCDVYIGFHGRKPLLLRFTNWLCAELEVQGISCFVADRACCQNARKHGIVERAMDACSFGVVILTHKSFRNPFTIEELLFFSGKKILVPVYLDLGPDDCLVRDIVERRGEMWEKYGGELWLLYGGLEKDWKDAVSALSRVDEWKLEAHDGNWRDCILRSVTLLALRLGRRSVVDRLTKWKEKVEKEEFPFPRNENFIGRKKELSELEFMLFGDASGDFERDYFELRPRNRRKNVTIGWGKSSSVEEKRREQQMESGGRRKGKEPVVWEESEKEIEMQRTEFLHTQQELPNMKSGGRQGRRRRRSIKIVYGKGIACVSGHSGIGKTELLLEFAYRFHQRYKMVLWVGGESRYIWQNYLNLWPFLEVDVGVENGLEKSRIKSFEEQEESAVARVRKEFMRNIPFLVVIDNLESEKNWWDHKLVMDLLPRFGGETHILISTRLPRVMNLEPLKLSYLSGVEAMSLMQGSVKDYPVGEIDALRVIEEKLGRLTLGIAIVGAILSELPINPSRLLDTINRMPSRDLAGSDRETHSMRRNNFLLKLFEVCFSIFDHADGPRSLATRMVQASGWFAPTAIPISLLALAAHKIPKKHNHTELWKKFFRSLTCGFSSAYIRKSEAEASSILLRFNIARSCTKEGHIQINEFIKLYMRKRGVTGAAQAMVQAVISRGSIAHHSEHIWAACFLLFGFSNDPIIVELKVSELLVLVKEVVLPLAIRTFITFSRCSAALELLRLCTNALEAADQAFITPVEKWLDKSLCWKPIQTNAQLNPCLWQELALSREREREREMGESSVSLPSGPDAKKRRVSYFYEPSIGDYYYGQGHPMKPHRIRMAHNLIVHYSLHRRMEINRPFPAAPDDIRLFHSNDYVDFLASVTPETLHDHTHARHLKRFNVGEDCPVFDGLFSFCQSSAGGSIGAAVKLNRQDADIAINWAGGLHHAKKSEASGFCYVNDIVLGILELLKVHRRVLYVDIDVHHGDGVEEAFFTTDRVMTVSFHKFGDFFPGTGHIKDIGVLGGKYYALNVPLNDGLDDGSFRGLFQPIIQRVMEVYQPDAVVLQCGADSLSGDRLGCFNLSVKGHADCLRFLRSFNVPLMVLGGGGYTIRNVARCWCYETAVAVGVEPDNKLPYNEYYEYFGPDYTLHVEPSSVENLNSAKDLEKIRTMLLEQLSRLPHAPSVPFQTTPATTQVPEEVEEHMDRRPKQRIWNGEDYESDADEDEKPRHQSLNFNPRPIANAEMRDIADGIKEENMTEAYPPS